MKRTMRLLAGILVVSLILGIALVGCGAPRAESKTDAKTETAASAPKDDAAKQTAADTAKKEPVKLKFTYWGSPVEKKAVEDILKKFQEKYNYITVDPMYIPNSDYLTKITSMMAGNDTPDLGYLFEVNAMDWALEDKLFNINDFLSKDTDLKKEAFLPNIWYDYAPGKSVGTNSACEAFGLLYNADLIKAAGVETPPTKAEDAWGWDKFVEVAKKLTIDANGKNALDPAFDAKKIKQYGVQFGTWWGPYMSAVFSNGGKFISDDGTKFELTSPEATEAIQKLSDLINVHHVAPSPAAAKGMPAPAVALQSKQVAMMIDGQWNLLDLGQAKFNFGVGVLPKLKKSVTIILGSPTVIFKSTKHPEEAWLLYKFLANPEGALDLMKGGLWMPLMKDWYTKPELVSKWAEGNPAHPEGYKDAIMKQTLENGIPSPVYYVKNFAKIDAIIGPALDQVWLGKKSAADALNEIAPKVQAEIKGRYDK